MCSELKWGVFKGKSIGLGALWALLVFIFMIADSEARLVGRAVDSLRHYDEDYAVMQYVAPAVYAKEALALDVQDLKAQHLEVLEAKHEEKPLGHGVWNVVICRGNASMPLVPRSLEKLRNHSREDTEPPSLKRRR